MGMICSIFAKNAKYQFALNASYMGHIKAIRINLLDSY